jgi:hypothetical protein
MPVISKIINPFLHNNYTQLAKVYKMKREKFSLIIEPIRDHIKVRDPYRNTLTWKEIWIIVEFLGAPDTINGIDPLYNNTITRLADLYRVERRTFSRWLVPIKHKFRQDNPYRTFIPREVWEIVEFLGEPGEVNL